MISPRHHLDRRTAVASYLAIEQDAAPRRVRRRRRGRVVLGGTLAVATLTATIAFAVPAPPSDGQLLTAYVQANPQSLSVHEATTIQEAARVDAAAIAPERDEFDATPGEATLIAGGTNYDWAKLVLLYGGWQLSDENVTVIVRWMRQENYVDAWWTRNNPLNIGSGGFASYGSLVEAAHVVANNLNSYGGYAGIRASLARSAPSAETEYAIWASPWAGGHYAWGDHWSYAEVPVVTAPASVWQ